MIDKTKILLVYRLLIILGITLVIASVYFLVAGSGFGWTLHGMQSRLDLFITNILLFMLTGMISRGFHQADRKALLKVVTFAFVAIAIDIGLTMLGSDLLMLIGMLGFIIAMIYLYSKYAYKPENRDIYSIIGFTFLIIVNIQCLSFPMSRHLFIETFQHMIDQHLVKLIFCWLLAIEGGIAIGISWRMRSYIIAESSNNVLAPG